MDRLNGREIAAVLRGGRIEADAPFPWPEGTRLIVRADHTAARSADLTRDRVIVAGFGLVGRCVAEYLERAGIPYVIIDANSRTVETQCGLGRTCILGDAADEETLRRSGIDEASVLALAIPDEQAVLAAIATARRLTPDIYIIARTNFTSAGLRAKALGADDVIKAEQAVALEFHECLRRRLSRRPGAGVREKTPDAEVAG